METKDPKKGHGPMEDGEGKTSGTSFGAAGGALLGGVVGSLGGPGGTIAGALAGAAAGATVGHAVGAGAKTHDSYWEENFRNEPYFEKDFRFPDYAPAFRLGYEDYPDLRGKPYEESEAWLAAEWERVKGDSPLSWEQARPATRAAWERARAGEFPDNGRDRSPGGLDSGGGF